MVTHTHTHTNCNCNVCETFVLALLQLKIGALSSSECLNVYDFIYYSLFKVAFASGGEG